ncbi:alpha/beta hydrolase [Amnibacterium sp.]|uniref:alpha/beta hydrolase n=1 Tax=Amnibacterium sp. TaxID=1872496 RepID=UPI003F7C8442
MYPNELRRTTHLRTRRVTGAALLAAGALLLAGCTSAAPAPTPSVTPAVEVVHDLQFAAPGGTPLLLDACTPKHVTGALPAVVIVHSGGFTQGSHSDLDWLCEQGAQHGFTAFTVDYRLLAKAHFPGQLDDVVAAVDWISATTQASRFHVDPKRITLLGTSAGATIVSELLTGVPGSPVPTSRFAGGALLSAAVDFTSVAGPGADISNAGVQVTLQYAGCSTTDCPELAALSAVRSVSHSDPPMFLANSTNELVPLDQAKEMDAALKSAGVRHELRIAQGTDHAEFIAQNHPDIDAAMWAFLRSTVR